MQDLVNNTLVALSYNDTMNFDLQEWGRQTTATNTTFMAIIESYEVFGSKFDGYLGLGPYSE